MYLVKIYRPFTVDSLSEKISTTPVTKDLSNDYLVSPREKSLPNDLTREKGSDDLGDLKETYTTKSSSGMELIGFSVSNNLEGNPSANVTVNKSSGVYDVEFGDIISILSTEHSGSDKVEFLGYVQNTSIRSGSNGKTLNVSCAGFIRRAQSNTFLATLMRYGVETRDQVDIDRKSTDVIRRCTIGNYLVYSSIFSDLVSDSGSPVDTYALYSAQMSQRNVLDITASQFMRKSFQRLNSNTFVMQVRKGNFNDWDYSDLSPLVTRLSRKVDFSGVAYNYQAIWTNSPVIVGRMVSATARLNFLPNRGSLAETTRSVVASMPNDIDLTSTISYLQISGTDSDVVDIKTSIGTETGDLKKVDDELKREESNTLVDNYLKMKLYNEAYSDLSGVDTIDISMVYSPESNTRHIDVGDTVSLPISSGDFDNFEFERETTESVVNDLSIEKDSTAGSTYVVMSVDKKVEGRKPTMKLSLIPLKFLHPYIELTEFEGVNSLTPEDTEEVEGFEIPFVEQKNVQEFFQEPLGNELVYGDTQTQIPFRPSR